MPSCGWLGIAPPGGVSNDYGTVPKTGYPPVSVHGERSTDALVGRRRVLHPQGDGGAGPGGHRRVGVRIVDAQAWLLGTDPGFWARSRARFLDGSGDQARFDAVRECGSGPVSPLGQCARRARGYGTRRAEPPWRSTSVVPYPRAVAKATKTDGARDSADRPQRAPDDGTGASHDSPLMAGDRYRPTSRFTLRRSPPA